MRIQNSGLLGVTSLREKQKAALSKSNERLSSVLEKLSTGRRINKASDDAAGLAIAELLTSQSRGLKMASRNTHDAMSALNVADGASSQVTEMVQRQSELAIQARNGTLNNSDREILNTEYQQLSQEITRISEATTFNGQKVANGTGLGDGTAEIAVDESGAAVTMPEVNIGAGHLGIDVTDISTAAGAVAAGDVLSDALDTINTQRSDIGAFTNRLESTDSNLQNAIINTTAAESLIRDQDMAEGIALMTKEKLLGQTAAKSFAMFNKLSGDHIMKLLHM